MMVRTASTKTGQEGGDAVTALARMQQMMNGAPSTGRNLLKIVHHIATMNRTDLRSNNMDTTRTLNLGQINISGLSSSSATSLNRFMTELNLSLVAVQETGLTEEKIEEISRSSDDTDFIGKAAGDSLRGVALIANKTLHAQRVPCLEVDDLDYIVWAIMKLDKLNVLVCSLYCSPSTGNTQTLTLQRLIANIEAAENFRLKHKLDILVALGDFNSRSIHWGDTKTNPRGNTLQGFVEASEFTLYTPGDKTFVCSGNGGSIIDLLLVSGHINHHISNYWIEQRMDLGSGAPLRGHFPVITSLSLKSQPRQRKHYMDFRKTDWALWKKKCDQYLTGWLNRHTSMGSGQEILGAVEESMKFANHVIPKKIVSPTANLFGINGFQSCHMRYRTSVLGFADMHRQPMYIY